MSSVVLGREKQTIRVDPDSISSAGSPEYIQRGGRSRIKKRYGLHGGGGQCEKICTALLSAFSRWGHKYFVPCDTGSKWKGRDAKMTMGGSPLVRTAGFDGALF